MNSSSSFLSESFHLSWISCNRSLFFRYIICVCLFSRIRDRCLEFARSSQRKTSGDPSGQFSHANKSWSNTSQGTSSRNWPVDRGTGKICAFWFNFCSCYWVIRDQNWKNIKYQNSSNGNYHQIDWNMKITAHNIKRTYILHSKYKRRKVWKERSYLIHVEFFATAPKSGKWKRGLCWKGVLFQSLEEIVWFKQSRYT